MRLADEIASKAAAANVTHIASVVEHRWFAVPNAVLGRGPPIGQKLRLPQPSEGCVINVTINRIPVLSVKAT